MAYPFITSDRAAWNSLVEDHGAIVDRLAKDRSDETERSLVDVEERILDSWAPDISGLIFKLELLWGARFHEDSREARQLCRIVGDIRRLTA